MESNIALSLCIPTDGKVELVKPAIESIYNQNADTTRIEVIVTDNGESDELEKLVKNFSFPNFHYYRTRAIGFTNQIDAIEKSSGLFCKLVSHRCRMLPGSINELLSIVDRYKDTKPIIYCTDGYIKADEIVECSNIDEFLSAMSYRTTWSGGTCAWKEDIANIRNITVNKLFPHTLFLFQLRDESKYIIWNKKITVMQDDRKKGGYDFYHAFAVDYLDILHQLRISSKITTNTFLKVKNDLFGFLTDNYIIEVIIPSRHQYILSGIKESMSVHYGRMYYYYMILIAYLILPYKVFRKLVLGKSVLER